MSSSSCCLSRHPPSPDGIAPRLAALPPSPLKLNPISPHESFLSLSGGSRSSGLEDAAAIQVTVKKDSSELATGGEKVISKKTSSALDTVKNRLKKHLSKDSGIMNSKRRSRVSVGTSEEEVGRRAELRRIRRKRIQEELSVEGIYDDDAKSFSTVGPADSCIKNLESLAPGHTLPMSSLVLPSLTLPESPQLQPELLPVALFNQKGPMLEALYFGLSNPSLSSMPRAKPVFSDDTSNIVNSTSIRSRRHSSPAASSPEPELGEPVVYHPTRKRSSLSELPSAPIIHPQRMPSIAEPCKLSWRLSFSAEKRGEQLRKLSQGNSIPLALNTEPLVQDSQSMRKWLHGQGLRSPPQAVLSSESFNLDASTGHFHTACTSSQDFGSVDGGGDSSSAMHLHQMGISQRLASKGLQSSCSSPDLSSVGSRSHHRGVSNMSANSRATHKRRVRYFRNTTDSLPLSERIPVAWGSIIENVDTIQDSASSFYPSTNNSIQPSPKSSRFNLFTLLASNNSKTELEGSRGASILSLNQLPNTDHLSPNSTSSQTLLGSSSVAIVSTSSSSQPLPFAKNHRRLELDVNSSVVSETESFREREVELSVLGTRFPATEACQNPKTPRSSKFREEFDPISMPSQEIESAKHSAFSRLARYAARSFDGSCEKRTGTPLTPSTPAIEHGYLQYRPRSAHAKGALTPVISPLEDESVMELWGNAVKRNLEPMTREIAQNLYIPGKKRIHDLTKKAPVSNQSEGQKSFAAKDLGWRMGDKESGSEESDKEADDKDWEAELAYVALMAKGRSKNSVEKPDLLDHRYPVSWSKFPSHDRLERTSSVKVPDDHVEVKDFATDESQFLDHNKKTFQEKLQKRIIAKLDKQATAEVQSNTERTYGRRSSMRAAGKLEYPELELLPLQNAPLMSHEEIARHVEEIMREEELDRKEELDAVFGLVEQVSPKAELQTGIAKSGTLKDAPDRSNVAEVIGMVSRDLVKRGLTARREPIARKSGEQSKPSITNLAPKIAPAVLIHATATEECVPRPMDGSMDHCDEDPIAAQVDSSLVDDGDVSIADPRFYDDCILHNSPSPDTNGCCDDSKCLDEMSPESKGSKEQDLEEQRLGYL